jgi:hypothetical protein
MGSQVEEKSECMRGNIHGGYFIILLSIASFALKYFLGDKAELSLFVNSYSFIFFLLILGAHLVEKEKRIQTVTKLEKEIRALKEKDR